MQDVRTTRWGLLGIALAVVLVAGACGSRTSSEKLVAMLEASETGSGAAPQPAAPSAAASATGVEADPAATASPEAGAAPAPTAVGGTAAAGSAARSSNSGATGTGSASPAPGQRASQAARPAQGQRPAAAAPGTPGSGGAKPAPGTAAAGCNGSGTPIIIGSVGSYSGVLGAFVNGGWRAVQAWAGRVNAAGGLNCHPVKYIVADDGSDAARNQSLVRRLVEEEKVIAFVFDGAPLTAQASVGYLNEKQIPQIGQEGGHMFTYESPMTFPIGAAAVPIILLTLAGGAKETVPKGLTKAANITCQEAEYCNVEEKVNLQRAKDFGYEMVYNSKVTFTQPDFTSICLAAQRAGAQVLLVGTDANSHQRLMANCARVNYRPIDVLTTVQMSNDFKDDPNMDGTVIASNVIPWWINQNPVIAEYQATLKQYAPSQPFDAVSVGGYAAAKAFEKAVSSVPPNQPVTSKDVLAGLYKLDGDDLGGITQKLRFAPGKPAKPVACGWTIVVSKKQFTSDGKIFCVKGLEP